MEVVPPISFTARDAHARAQPSPTAAESRPRHAGAHSAGPATPSNATAGPSTAVATGGAVSTTPTAVAKAPVLSSVPLTATAKERREAEYMAAYQYGPNSPSVPTEDRITMEVDGVLRDITYPWRIPVAAWPLHLNLGNTEEEIISSFLWHKERAQPWEAVFLSASEVFSIPRVHGLEPARPHYTMKVCSAFSRYCYLVN